MVASRADLIFVYERALLLGHNFYCIKAAQIVLRLVYGFNISNKCVPFPFQYC